MLLVPLFIFVLGVILLWLAHRRQKLSGLPAGRIIYSDTQNWRPSEKSLYDPVSGLTGKPDYLVEHNGQIIPVEIKQSRVHSGPYDGHIFQLAAYCRLVQIEYGKRPAYGILHYANQTFAIDYTPELEDALDAILTEMHNQDHLREVGRSHQTLNRCLRCGYQAGCEQKLQ